MAVADQRLIERMISLLLRLIESGSFTDISDYNEAVELLCVSQGLTVPNEGHLTCYLKIVGTETKVE